MKKNLTLITFALFAYNAISQYTKYGSTDIIVNNNLITSMEITFDDAQDIDDGFYYEYYHVAPQINESTGKLELTTNINIDNQYDWWELGYLSYFKFNETEEEMLAFNISEGAIGQFTVETPVPIGYWLKLDYETWTPDNAYLALEHGDTITTTDQLVSIHFDFKQAAIEKGIDTNSVDFKRLYLWIWALGSTEPHIINLHNFTYSNEVNVAPLTTSENIDFNLETGNDTIFDLNTIFSDPNGDILSYEISEITTDFADVYIEENLLFIETEVSELFQFTVTATDPFGNHSDYQFSVEILETNNHTLIVQNEIDSLIIESGFEILHMNLDTIFRDMDNNELTYYVNNN